MSTRLKGENATALYIRTVCILEALYYIMAWHEKDEAKMHREGDLKFLRLLKFVLFMILLKTCLIVEVFITV